jgi:hypothetical protein
MVIWIAKYTKTLCYTLYKMYVNQNTHAGARLSD